VVGGGGVRGEVGRGRRRVGRGASVEAGWGALHWSLLWKFGVVMLWDWVTGGFVFGGVQ
jgi:hypothetical protein